MGSLLELLAQMADVDVDGAGVAVLGVAPDVLEQRLAAQHPAGGAGEGAEDLELDVGELRLLAAQGHHAAAEVDRQVAALDRLLLGRVADHPRAPQGGLDPAAELAHREGLGDVVVGADLEPGDLVGLAAFRGQHDDRHLAARAQLAADLDPVELGQHQVEDDEVEARLVEALERFAAVVGAGHVVAVLAQRIAEQRLDRLLVVHKEYACRPIGHRERLIPCSWRLVERAFGPIAQIPWTNVLLPETQDLGAWADRRAMQSEQLKSLVETGNYRPKPALIAEAMLRRRGVRELLVTEPTSINAAVRNPAGFSLRPPGSLISTPEPAITSPTRVIASPGGGRPAHRDRALGRQRRQQLVVLAARDRQLRAGRPPAAAATSATPSASGKRAGVDQKSDAARLGEVARRRRRGRR